MPSDILMYIAVVKCPQCGAETEYEGNEFRPFRSERCKLLDFGAIVSVLPGKDGLLHISQIADERVKAVSDHLKEGQAVRVKVLENREDGEPQGQGGESPAPAPTPPTT